MEIPLFTSEIFGDEIKLSIGNEQIHQSPSLIKEDFIAILTNLINENIKKTSKETKLLSQSFKGIEDFNLNIDNFSDVLGDSSKGLKEKIKTGEEELRIINALIGAILDALNSAINNIENNHKVILKIDETQQDLLSLDSTEDLDTDLMQPAIKNPKVLAQKADLLIYNDSKSDNLDIEKTIKVLPEKYFPQRIFSITSESSEEIFKNIDSKPELENSLLQQDLKDGKAISAQKLDSLIYSDSKNTNADILKHSFNEHSDQNENNSYEMKYTSQEIPFSHSGQTFSDSLDKNLQIDSSIQKIKVINHEGQDINEIKIYFSKVDNSTVRLEIKPEGMGLCDIELILENGVVNAHILASESAGKNFFDSNLSNIMNNLIRDGLNLGKFSVSLGDRKEDENDEKGGGKQKAAKLIEEVNLLDNHYKNSLISIFI